MLVTLQSLWILMFSSVCWTFLIKTSLLRMIYSIWSKTKFEVLDTSTMILAFRSCRIQYIVAAKASLREKLTNLLPCQVSISKWPEIKYLVFQCFDNTEYQFIGRSLVFRYANPFRPYWTSKTGSKSNHFRPYWTSKTGSKSNHLRTRIETQSKISRNVLKFNI